MRIKTARGFTKIDSEAEAERILNTAWWADRGGTYSLAEFWTAVCAFATTYPGVAEDEQARELAMAAWFHVRTGEYHTTTSRKMVIAFFDRINEILDGSAT